jgi:hypothetical protein
LKGDFSTSFAEVGIARADGSAVNPLNINPLCPPGGLAACSELAGRNQ